MGLTDDQLLAKREELMQRDIGQMAQLKSYGVDLDKKRQIDLTFWAPNEKAAQVFVEACTRNEMPPHTVLGPTIPEGDQRWLIRCSFSGSPTFVTTKENAVTFLMFANKYDCEYDGWGTAVVEAAALSKPIQ
jgi:Regulator of ribonuclease activity B